MKTAMLDAIARVDEFGQRWAIALVKRSPRQCAGVAACRPRMERNNAHSGVTAVYGIGRLPEWPGRTSGSRAWDK